MPKDSWQSARSEYRNTKSRRQRLLEKKIARGSDPNHWSHTPETASGPDIERCRKFIEMLVKNGLKHETLEKTIATRYPRSLFMPILNQIRMRWLKSHQPSIQTSSHTA